ncbi:MAG: AAA domain-containing protein, partial [Bacteroidales bacterium]|nr:AAA domain-containing protein [Bacteroidales bacterium]
MDTEKNASKHSNLCQYYLECLSQDNTGISLNIDYVNPDRPDYFELQKLPETYQELNDKTEYQKLKSLIRTNRSRLGMYLGYPLYIKKDTKGWKGHSPYKLEPILLYPIDELSDYSPIDYQNPIFNQKPFESFSNEKENLIYELIELEKELSLSNNNFNMPELIQKLNHIRSEWPWQEKMDIGALSFTEESPLIECTETGIFNKAVLFVSEQSPFTKGLEFELSRLSELKGNDIQGTALHHWVNNAFPSNSQEPIDEVESLPLLELLPLNNEQRESINKSLSQPISIITGPPGTGKSQVVTNLLLNAVWQGKKVLFASKNNKAVDVVEERLNALANRNIMIRAGGSDFKSKVANYILNLLSISPTVDEISYKKNITKLTA